MGRGRAVSVKLVPKEEHSRSLFSFRETCVYFKSGCGTGSSSMSPQEERKELVQELCRIPKDTHISFLGGDMNIHHNDILEPYLSANNMEEVEQDINTFYRMEKEKISATRIDRWYCNISAAQATIVSPTSRVLTSTIGTIGRYSDKGDLSSLKYIPTAGTKGSNHFTDHVPVGLYLPPPGEGGNATNNTSIPAWVVRHPLFKSTNLNRRGVMG